MATDILYLREQYKQKLQKSDYDFEEMMFLAFQIQYNSVPVYQKFCEYLNKSPRNVSKANEIPFFPIQFFKKHQVFSDQLMVSDVFTSSSTTGTGLSSHYVHDLEFYWSNTQYLFENSYSKIKDSIFLFLLPSYLERKGSSLVSMAQYFITLSGEESGFYLNDFDSLTLKINTLEQSKKKVYLFGVSFGLLDYIESCPQIRHNKFSVIDTGGMKGRREELTRDQVHSLLKKYFNLNSIGSEYGMTELLSQAYSEKEGVFKQNNRLKALIRDLKNPFDVQYEGVGALNVVDLVNIDSCCFIATDDQGRVSKDNFEILGRIDHSDMRGCSLMVSE